jgi:hypothetical protein
VTLSGSNLRSRRGRQPHRRTSDVTHGTRRADSLLRANTVSAGARTEIRENVERHVPRSETALSVWEQRKGATVNGSDDYPATMTIEEAGSPA